MARFDSKFGSTAGIATLALALVAVPVASAFATAEQADATLSAEQVVKGRALFTDNGCVACHTLADANAAGTVGPSFDGDTNLDKAYAVGVITEGRGPMPSFSWLGEEDINLIASYVVQVKK